MTKSREKFVELAEKRVTRAIKDIRLIGNLSNRNNYEFSDDDVTKIIVTLEKEIRDVKNRFRQSSQGGEVSFHL